MDMYSCPSCKTQNHEHQKYCYKCGTWLQSTAFPAKKIASSGQEMSSANKKKVGYLIPVIIIALILFGLYRWENEAKFDKMEVGGKYVLTQFVIKRPVLRAPSAAADFTALEDVKDPIELTAVFYAGDGSRLGTSYATILQSVDKGQTTTINFTFDGRPMLSDLKQVRVEVKPVSPIQMLERAADKLNKLPQLKQ